MAGRFRLRHSPEALVIRKVASSTGTNFGNAGCKVGRPPHQSEAILGGRRSHDSTQLIELRPFLMVDFGLLPSERQHQVFGMPLMAYGESGESVRRC
jgi:hypothetical protein